MIRRLAALAATATLVALALSGCKLTDPYVNQRSDGGQPSANVVAGLETMPGVNNAWFRLESWSSPGEGGLFSASGMHFVIGVDIERGYRIADPSVFLEQVMSAAWSVNDGYSPKGVVRLTIAGGVDIDYDWESAIAEIYGVTNPRVDREGRQSGILLSLSDDVLRQNLGNWPSAPIELGAGLVEEGEPVEIYPAAVLDFGYYGVTSVQDCWGFSFTLGVSDGVIYPGDVTVSLLVGDKVQDTQVSRGANRDPESTRAGLQFCYDGRKPGNFNNVGFRISSEPVEGFRTVEVDRFGP